MKEFLSLFLFCSLFITSTYSQSVKPIQNSAGWTPGGMYYELYSRVGGDSAKEGNIVKFKVTQIINDSVIYSTDKRIIPYYQQVGPVSPYDISEMWQRMKIGDSLYAVQLMDTFLLRSPEIVPTQFKKGDSIKIYLKVLDIFERDSLATADLANERDKQLKKEVEFLSDYLKQKNIKATKTPGGAFVEIITEGTGNLIESGNTVSVKYLAMLFDGKAFDSNIDDSFGHTDPLSFKTGEGGMIKGFDEAILLLKNGSKARVYVPSMLAYGENPPAAPLSVLENLVFEITILSVSK